MRPAESNGTDDSMTGAVCAPKLAHGDDATRPPIACLSTFGRAFPTVARNTQVSSAPGMSPMTGEKRLAQNAAIESGPATRRPAIGVGGGAIGASGPPRIGCMTSLDTMSFPHSLGSADSESRGKNGESGIRTHGTVAGSPVFKTGALNHSTISPELRNNLGQGVAERERSGKAVPPWR